MKFLKVVLFLVLIANASFLLIAMDVPISSTPQGHIIVITKPGNLCVEDQFVLHSTSDNQDVNFKPEKLWPELLQKESDIFCTGAVKTYQCNFDVPVTSINLLKNIALFNPQELLLGQFDKISLEQLKDVATMIDTLDISCTIGHKYKVKEYLIARKIRNFISFISSAIEKSCSDLQSKEQVQYVLEEFETQIKNQFFCTSFCDYLATLNSAMQSTIKKIVQQFDIGYDDIIENVVYDERNEQTSMVSQMANIIFDAALDPNNGNVNLAGLMQQWEKLAAIMIEKRLQRIADPKIVYPKDVLKKNAWRWVSINRENEFILYNKTTGHECKIVAEFPLTAEIKSAIVDEQKKYHVWSSNQNDVINKIMPSELSDQVIDVVSVMYFWCDQSRKIRVHTDSVLSIINNRFKTLSPEEKNQMTVFFNNLGIVPMCYCANDETFDLRSLVVVTNNPVDSPQSSKPIVESVINPSNSPQKGMPWQFIAALLAAGVGVGSYFLYKWMQQK